MNPKNPIEPEMNPANETPPGTADHADHACPKCEGSGMLDDGTPCQHCGGTGKVISGITPA